MKKVLVLVAAYPTNDGGVSLAYVHTRNLEYVKNGIDVTVLNFSSKIDYIKDGIPVISFETFKKDKNDYGLLILHAANLRNHYRFLKKYDNRFNQLLFFYHGHEVMKINKQYSKPYDYVKHNKLRKKAEDVYDEFKLLIWKKYLRKNLYKCHFIYVSKWMKRVFDENVGYSLPIKRQQWDITYNSVGEVFEKGQYDDSTEKKYDFVTIRGVLDGSKYAVDIVNQLAKNTPKARFLIIGKGEFFSHYEKAINLEWRDTWLSQGEIIDVLQQARYALMPTRTDAQGLMMCEMAAFGIPVITSDIEVCHEVFDGFDNAFYINNDDSNISLERFLETKYKSLKDHRFFKENTVKHEIHVIKNMLMQC